MRWSNRTVGQMESWDMDRNMCGGVKYMTEMALLGSRKKGAIW